MFTDYPGALRRVIPFETHGKIDVVQALMAAVLPVALGFSSEGAAVPFQLQAINEFAVVSTTDWQSAADEQIESWQQAS